MNMQSSGVKGRKAFSARNYLLLIIGLIAFICFTLGLVLAVGSEFFTAGQTWFLILFLTLFAFFSVSIVTWLVLRHAKKLAVAQFDESLEWRTSTPEKQKRRLNAEVGELARALQIPGQQFGDLRSAFIVAEDLALRKIQNDTGIPLMRKVSIGTGDFDAVYIDKDLVTCVAVTFVVKPLIPPEKINRMLRETSAAKGALSKVRTGSRIRLLLILVTQLDPADDKELRSNVAVSFESTPVDVDIRLMDFQKLQKLYSDE